MTNEIRRREIAHLYRRVTVAANEVWSASSEAAGAEVSPLLVEHLETARHYLDRALDELTLPTGRINE